MTRGVLMIAHNNTEIDYFKIACTNALMVKKNLGVSITLITDSGTFKWAKSQMDIAFINQCFEKIIEVQKNHKFDNMKNFADTSYSVKPLQFYNCNHWEAYQLSPYDETLFIDTDYLIMSDALNNCWGSINDVMINHKIYSPLDDTPPTSTAIDNLGIRLYWATVIYFKKSSLAEHLFNLVRNVQENYEYYKDLYYISNGMFRNDNAVSIAAHMLNGFGESNEAITELPIPGLLMSWDINDIQQVNGINDITLYCEKDNNKGEYILTRIKNTDIHIMNKWSINRHADTLLNLYKEIA